MAGPVLWVELCSPERMCWKSWPLVLRNVTSFGNRVSAGVIKLGGDHTGITGGYEFHDWCPFKRRECHVKTEIQSEVGHVMVDTEIVSTSQGMPRIAGNHQKLVEARKTSPLHISEGSSKYLDLGLLASSSTRQVSIVVSHPSMWCFVTAVLGNECNWNVVFGAQCKVKMGPLLKIKIFEIKPSWGLFWVPVSVSLPRLQVHKDILGCWVLKVLDPNTLRKWLKWVITVWTDQPQKTLRLLTSFSDKRLWLSHQWQTEPQGLLWQLWDRSLYFGEQMPSSSLLLLIKNQMFLNDMIKRLLLGLWEVSYPGTGEY